MSADATPRCRECGRPGWHYVAPRLGASGYFACPDPEVIAVHTTDPTPDSVAHIVRQWDAERLGIGALLRQYESAAVRYGMSLSMDMENAKGGRERVGTTADSKALLDEARTAVSDRLAGRYPGDPDALIPSPVQSPDGEVVKVGRLEWCRRQDDMGEWWEPVRGGGWYCDQDVSDLVDEVLAARAALASAQRDMDDFRRESEKQAESFIRGAEIHYRDRAIRAERQLAATTEAVKGLLVDDSVDPGQFEAGYDTAIADVLRLLAPDTDT